uniref:PRKCA-binding protein n=1 Tax=Eptatretus burgeri TaxID=7764 RepID=A0A8C4R8N6_EPTBU
VFLELLPCKWGIPIVPGTVVLQKDPQNMIGISIGGGAPLCPCLYVVQVFDNTPASHDGTLAAGDELVGVNGKSVKGKTKVEVAKMIQAVKGEVTMYYNKLQADPKQGKTLDIVMKKVKHRFVEGMSSGTADSLGLSRAILCNGNTSKPLADIPVNTMNNSSILVCAFRGFRSLVLPVFSIEAKIVESKFLLICLEEISVGLKVHCFYLQMLSDLSTYLNKAVPDTKLTIKKYADGKFEYLSYCLKVKEMDDEEYTYTALQEPLYRVCTGNYEYRLILRCRQEARDRFARLRKDVLEKIELLDQKHVQDIVFQLQRFVSAMSHYHDDCCRALKHADVFPIEVDLTRTMQCYNPQTSYTDDELEPMATLAEDKVGSRQDAASTKENGEKLLEDF